MTVEILQGGCRKVMAGMEPDSFDACVCDPPYHLTSIVKRFGATSKDTSGVVVDRINRGADGYARMARGFMGKVWDGGDVAFRPETWAAVYRVLKPGAHLLAFGGTRTYHRLACAIEDAGFEIRDSIIDLIASDTYVQQFAASLSDAQRLAFFRCIEESQFGGLLLWIFASGFPKSHDVSRAIDRAAGAEREVVGEKIFADGTRARRTQHLGGNVFADPVSRESNLIITAPATEAARQWAGWGTALKPACEPIVVARKPSVAVSSDELHGLTGWDHWCSAKSDGEDKIVTGRALHPDVRSYRARLDKNGREIAREDLGAYEPFAVDAVAANVLRHGTGAINVDASRVGYQNEADLSGAKFANGSARSGGIMGKNIPGRGPQDGNALGRWPANIAHDGSPEVLAAFARFGDAGGGYGKRGGGGSIYSEDASFRGDGRTVGFGDTGTAARFFFCAKATADERVGNHPTVKPVALMEWLVRMVTPPGGRVLDPFCGTGSTLVACDRLGFDAVGIEQDAQTVADAHEKIRRMRARRLIGETSNALRSLPGQAELAL